MGSIESPRFWGQGTILNRRSEGLRGDEECDTAAALTDQVSYLVMCPRNTVPVQLLAYHVARAKGTDVDQPRNLAKSVTV
jgi:glutamine---fructose-6-phosphate transaminase (isomerizing)